METIADVKTLYTHLVCSKTGERYEKQQLHTYSRHHKPLLARYHLEAGLDRRLLRQRPPTMWRYREVLPVENDANMVSLGEGMTPCLPLERLGRQNNLPRLFLKDESANPTGSFKARGLSMAVSKAKELGVHTCAIPTAGNAGGALAAYCARAGMQAHVFMPRATPDLFRKECEYFGAEVTLVEGSIGDCARRLAEVRQADWFDISTLKEPFRLEGKKTMGYEIAEQFDWRLPEVIVYPTGGGTGLIGMWKAFGEMQALGWIGAKRPRMVAVQVTACAPIVRAFKTRQTQAAPLVNPAETMANGLRVPAAFGDELILRCLYESGGTALAVTEEEMRSALRDMAKTEGLLLAPEGAAVWAAAQTLRQQGWIGEEETVLLLNTGSAYKYMEHL